MVNCNTLFQSSNCNVNITSTSHTLRRRSTTSATVTCPLSSSPTTSPTPTISPSSTSPPSSSPAPAPRHIGFLYFLLHSSKLNYQSYKLGWEKYEIHHTCLQSCKVMIWERDYFKVLFWMKCWRGREDWIFNLFLQFFL